MIEGVVTAKVALAVWPPPFVATTDVPEVPVGTAKVQVNVPLELVVSEPLLQLDIDTESKRSEASGVEALKPEPETVTDAPAGPWPGLTEIAGIENVTPTPRAPPLTVNVGADDQAYSLFTVDALYVYVPLGSDCVSVVPVPVSEA